MARRRVKGPLPSRDRSVGSGETSRFLPWALLALFVPTHAFLAHVPLSPLARGLAVVGGLLLPLAAILALGARSGEERKRSDPDPGGIFPWALFGAAFLVAHLHRLDTLPPWTHSDQAVLQFDALRLRERWDGELLRGGNLIEPLYTWLLALYLKVVPPDGTSVRLFTVLVSLGTTLLSHWAARAFLNRTASFSVAWLTGLGFLPFMVARTGLHSSLVLPATFWCLGILGRHRKARDARGRVLTGLHLGLAVGAGFYTYTSWPAVAAWVLLSTVVLDLKGPVRRPWAAFAATAVAALVALPVLMARMELGSAYASTLFKPDVANGMRAYLIGFLWDGFRSPPFGPASGGSLNALVAGLAFLGAALWRPGRRLGRLLWALSFLAATLLPGALTRYVQMHRVVQAYPFFAAAAALGLLRLSGTVPRRWRTLLVLGFLAASTALDARHFLGPYQDPTRYREENTRHFDAQSPLAAGYLKAWAKERGPLLVLEQFHMRDNGAFAVPLFPIDATRNRRLDAAKADWVAVLTNVHYRPFLEGEFPSSTWFWAGEGARSSAGGMAVGLFPREGATRDRLDRWVAANAWLRNVWDERTRMVWGARHRMPLAVLGEGYPLFKGDPFLETLYFERKASLECLDTEYKEAVQDLRRALLLGYPAAHVYFDLGMMLDLAGDREGATRAYRYAMSCKPDHTLARERLEELSRR
jgi:4-amino-4-deoxy-L-arabinose transferase-like glycosyltransferase